MSVAIGSPDPPLEIVEDMQDLTPDLTGEFVDDFSRFIIDGSQGGVFVGHGTIRTVRQWVIANTTWRVENQFSLGPNDHFVQAISKVTLIATPLATPLTNFRLFVGVRDDSVGTDGAPSDVPTKRRGVFSNGVFTEATTFGTAGLNAIEAIGDSDAAVAYASNVPGSETFLDICCAFSNAINKPTANTEASQTSDGSYGLGMPLGAMSVGTVTAPLTWVWSGSTTAEVFSFEFPTDNTVCANPALCKLKNNCIGIGPSGQASITTQGFLNNPQFSPNCDRVTYLQSILGASPQSAGLGVRNDVQEMQALGPVTQDPNDPLNFLNDFSRFIIDVQVGSVFEGHGSIRTVRLFDTNGRRFRVDNTYTLRPNDRFLQVVAVITLVSGSFVSNINDASNFRYFVGVRDDAVNNDDVSTKQRGVFKDGVFTIATVNDQKNQNCILDLGNTNDFAAVYASNIPGTQTFVGSCCAFTNAINAPILTPSINNDGSHALGMPLGLLNVGEQTAPLTYTWAGSTKARVLNFTFPVLNDVVQQPIPLFIEPLFGADSQWSVDHAGKIVHASTSTLGPYDAVLFGDSKVGDRTFQAVVTFNGDIAGIGVGVTSTSYFMCRLDSRSTEGLSIVQFDNTFVIQRSFDPDPVNTPINLKIEVVGLTVKCFKNGNLVVSAQVSTPPNGRLGLFVEAASATFIPDVLRCNAGFFVNALTGSCQACTTCSAGETRAGIPCDGLGTSDSQFCIPCSPCNVGQFQSARCTGGPNQATACSSCQSCGPGFFVGEQCFGGDAVDVQLQNCVACNECDPGQFSPNACPGNTFFDTQAFCTNCTSACNPGFFLSGTCEGNDDFACAPCASCATGRFHLGSPCDGLSDVDTQPCADCKSSCPSGSILSGTCEDFTDFDCTPCSECAPGRFAPVPCDSSSFVDTQCQDCISSCGPGSFRSGTCGGSSDFTCAPCTTCPAGRVQIGSCDGTSTSDVQQCQDCLDRCPVGQFLTGACSGTNDFVCQPCAASCEGGGKGTFVPCPGNTFADVSRCECELGSFLSLPPRTCTECKSTCSAGQFRSGVCSPTGSSDFTCAGCTLCSAGQFRTGVDCDGTALVDTQTCQACSTCDLGFRRTGTCLADEKRDFGCAACLSCPFGFFQNGTVCDGIGFVDTQQCRECKFCGRDEFRGGSCQGVTDFTCQPCTTCVVGAEFSVAKTCDGTDVTNTEICQSCKQVCARGSFLTGTCLGTTDFSCQECRLGFAYDCGLGFFRKGTPCSGLTHNDTQLLGCEACVNTVAGAYQCPRGQFTNGTQCSGLGFSDTQSCQPFPVAQVVPDVQGLFVARIEPSALTTTFTMSFTGAVLGSDFDVTSSQPLVLSGGNSFLLTVTPDFRDNAFFRISPIQQSRVQVDKTLVITVVAVTNAVLSQLQQVLSVFLPNNFCPAGHFCPGNGVQTPCPTGTFTGAEPSRVVSTVFSQAARCIPCPVNTFSSTPAASSPRVCGACPAGKTTEGLVGASLAGPVFCLEFDNCLPNSCSNGTCVDLPLDQVRCDCFPGFTGLRCELEVNDCEPNPCNGQVCTDLFNDFRCTCANNKVGKTCNVDTELCVANSCNGHGSCATVLVNNVPSVQCRCDVGFEGTFCQTDINECATGPCFHGSCRQGVPGTFSCICDAGFEGRLCDVEINECLVGRQDPCNGGGVCVDKVASFSCQCFPGRSGQFCEVVVDNCALGPCFNGGNCTSLPTGFVCACPPGFTGNACQIDVDECQSEPCKNGARCVNGRNDFSCNCPPGLLGKDCSINPNDCTPTSCSNGAECVDEVNGFRCLCPPGFNGLTCGNNIDDCLNTPCQNDGVCVDGVNSFTCQCRDGFEGVVCQSEVLECNRQPCLNGGTCVDFIGGPGHECFCPVGFEGLACEIDIDECAENPCGNGGTCTQSEVPGEFSCTCIDPFLPETLCNVAAAPQALLARVSNNGESVVVSFDLPLGESTIVPPRPCNTYFEPATILKFGDTATCSFVTSSRLVVAQSSSAPESWQVLPGDVILVKPGLTLLGASGFVSVATSLTLSAPTAPIGVQVVLASIPTATACSPVFVDASASTGRAGRALEFDYTLLSAEPAISAAQALALSDFLAANRNVAAFVLPAGILPAARTTQIRVRARNWLGSTGDVTVSITRLAPPQPIITSNVDAFLVNEVDHNADFTLQISVVSAACPGQLSSRFSWTQSPLNSPTLDLGAVFSTSSAITIKKGQFRKNQDYQVVVTVSSTLFNDIQLLPETKVFAIRQAVVQPPRLTRARLAWSDADFVSQLGSQVIRVTDSASGQVTSQVVLTQQATILLEFSEPTNRANFWQGSVCSELVTLTTLAQLAPNTKCVWLADELFQLSWTDPPIALIDGVNLNTNDEATLLVGEPIRILPGVVTDLEGLSDPIQVVQEAVLEISVSGNEPRPVIVISGPSDIGVCSPLALNILSSTGTGGRTLSNIKWSLVFNEDAQALSGARRNALADAIRRADTYGIIIPPALIPANFNLEIEVEATNWLGLTGTGRHRVHKNSVNTPVVTIVGGGNHKISVYDGAAFTAQVQAASCDDGTQIPVLTSWTITFQNLKNGEQPIVISSDTTSLDVVLANIRPEQSYGLRFVARLSADPSVESSTEIFVEVDAVPPPLPLSARFTDNVNRIDVAFDQPTNRAGQLAEVFDCSIILRQETVDKLGGGSSCTWGDASLLSVNLGNGMSLTLDDRLLFQDDILQTFDGFSSFTQNASSVILPPLNPPVPIARVVGRLSLGNCDPVQLDGSISSGSANQPFVAAWRVVPNPVLSRLSAVELARIQAVLDTQTTVLLSVEPLVFPPGRSYQIQLCITNFLGGQACTEELVSISAAPVPVLQLQTPSLVLLQAGQTLDVSVLAITSTCGAVEQVLTYLWRELDGEAPFAFNPGEDARKFLSIRGDRLQPGSSYTFELTVTADNNALLTVSAVVRVQVSLPNIVATIAGGDRLEGLGDGMPQNLTLDASASRDPLGGSIGDLTFQWSCLLSTGAKCFDPFLEPEYFTDSPVITIPRDDMLASIEQGIIALEDVWVFAVTVSRGVRSAAAQVSIDLRISVLPTVVVSLQSRNLQGAVDPSQRVRISCAASIPGDDDQNNFVFSWSNLNLNLNMSDAANFAIDIFPEPISPDGVTPPLVLDQLSDFFAPGTGQTLVTDENKLVPGVSFTFACHARHKENLLDAGRGSVAVRTSAAPCCGLCVLSSATGAPISATDPIGAVVDLVSVRCQDWVAADARDGGLTYSLFAIVNDFKVAISAPQPGNTAGLTLPLGTSAVIAVVSTEVSRDVFATVEFPVSVVDPQPSKQSIDILVSTASRELRDGSDNGFQQLCSGIPSLLANVSGASVEDVHGYRTVLVGLIEQLQGTQNIDANKLEAQGDMIQAACNSNIGNGTEDTVGPIKTDCARLAQRLAEDMANRGKQARDGLQCRSSIANKALSTLTGLIAPAGGNFTEFVSVTDSLDSTVQTMARCLVEQNAPGESGSSIVARGVNVDSTLLLAGALRGVGGQLPARRLLDGGVAGVVIPAAGSADAAFELPSGFVEQIPPESTQITVVTVTIDNSAHFDPIEAVIPPIVPEYNHTGPIPALVITGARPGEQTKLQQELDEAFRNFVTVNFSTADRTPKDRTQITSLNLHDNGLGVQLELENLTTGLLVTFQYNPPLPDDQDPICQFWDTKRLIWTADGCTLLEFDNVTQIVRCQCNRANAQFSGAGRPFKKFLQAALDIQVNRITIKDLKRLANADFRNHPVTLITVLCLLGVYILLFPLAKKQDRDDKNIHRVRAYGQKWSQTLLYEVRNPDQYLTCSRVLRRNYRDQHLEYSIFARGFGDSFTSTARLTVIFTMYMWSLAICALFYGQQQKSVANTLQVSIISAVIAMGASMPLRIIFAKAGDLSLRDALLKVIIEQELAKGNVVAVPVPTRWSYKVRWFGYFLAFVFSMTALFLVLVLGLKFEFADEVPGDAFVSAPPGEQPTVVQESNEVSVGQDNLWAASVFLAWIQGIFIIQPVRILVMTFLLTICKRKALAIIKKKPKEGGTTDVELATGGVNVMHSDDTEENTTADTATADTAKANASVETVQA